MLCLVSTIAAADLFAQTTQATGPLSPHPTNPRYFADPSGKAVYLTGSHVWSNMQDGNGVTFNFTNYLNLLKTSNHNFIRLWTSETPQADIGVHPAPGWNGSTPWYQSAAPLPFARTGPGTAADGQPKFNLNQFNQAYFDRLRARVIAARDQGLYVGIMLFNFWTSWNANDWIPGRNVWRFHPFHVNNNVSGINGDPNGNGNGEETHKLQVAAVTQIQEAYVKKVIDTVNDLDNVIYEISNEDMFGDPAWQYHLIDVIKTYEAGKPKQHPVGMTGAQQISTSVLLSQPGDWTSFNATTYDGPNDPYISNPPAADGTRISVLDSDHLGYMVYRDDAVLTRAWVWKSFTRGHNPLLMEDLGGSPGLVAGRAALGHTRSYAVRMDLGTITPQNSRSSTGYCLANPGSEYLAYQPGSGTFSLDLVANSYSYEWFNPVTGSVVSTGVVGAVGGNQSFTPPFSGPAVLYLKASSVAPAAEVMSASPLGHWKFDDGTGTTASDASGNGYSGTLVNGPVWTTGQLTGALSFDGVNDYVQVNNSGALSPQKFTVAVWMNAASFANTNWNSMLVNLGVHDWTSGFYGLAVNTSGVPVAMLNIGGGSSNAYYLNGSALPVGQWRHLAMTYDNSTLKLYVNGALVGQMPINRVRTTGTGALIMGRRSDSGYQFKGLLDDVRVYSQALTQTDIASLASTAPTTTSPPPPPASPPPPPPPPASPPPPPPPPSGGETVSYQASADFSTVQGQRGWYYLDSQGRQLTYDSGAKSWRGSEYYLLLWNNGGHPGNQADAVRRWVAPATGTVQLTGTASDTATEGGGGVTVLIRKGSTVLWQQAIANGNTTGVSFNVTTTVATGEAIDFVINRGADGNHSWDSTRFDPSITYTTTTTSSPPPPPPPPASPPPPPPPPPPSGGTIFTASANFSGTQGQNGWYYQDSQGRLMTYNAGTSTWQGAETYLRLWATGGHPGNAADAVRRWVAPSAGSVQVTGKAFDGASDSGGGVTVLIKKGSSVLWQQAIANGNTTGVSFNVTTTVATGEAIDFVINRGADGNNSYDTTSFDPTITYTTLSGTGTQSALLTWNANSEADLAGYRIYQRTESGTYGSPIAVGKVTSYTVTNLVSGTRYYFRMTAVDTSGNESSPSSEVSILK